MCMQRRCWDCSKKVVKIKKLETALERLGEFIKGLQNKFKPLNEELELTRLQIRGLEPFCVKRKQAQSIKSLSAPRSEALEDALETPLIPVPNEVNVFEVDCKSLGRKKVFSEARQSIDLVDS